MFSSTNKPARFLWFLLTALVLPLFAHAQSDPEYTSDRKVIRNINIHPLDAFDPSIPEYRRFVFRFLNKLHVRTNSGFIRRELLLREGDIADRDLMEESERNLRSLMFLDNVSITQIPVDSRTVDLDVQTEDQWTLQFNISAGASKGVSTYDFEVSESNFLGLGKTVDIGYFKGPERTSYLIGYKDPQFLNSRWNFNFGFEDASDGSRYTSDLIRPFYSIDTRWAYGMSWDSGSATAKLHYKGETVAEIDTDHRNALFFAARSWGERYNKIKFGGIFNADSFLYPHAARIILPEATSVKAISTNLHPVDRENYSSGAMFQWDRQHWVEEHYLDNFGRVEDMPDGFMMGSMLTRSVSVDNNPDYFNLYTLAQYSKQVTSRQYFSMFGEFSGHRDDNGSINNIYFNGYVHYYFKLPQFNLGKVNFPLQTMAANLSTTLTSNIDAPFQISLGEDEGLRGYTFKSFNGQNRILFNLEDRIFTPLDFRIIAVGLVGFLDAGYVWSGDQHLMFRDFGISTGFGLRIGLKKSQSAKVVRVDFAIPLRQESGFTTSSKKGWSISVSSGQIFNVIGEVPKLFKLF